MIQIPFTKLHGAENDFLVTWSSDVPPSTDLALIARRICARNTGIGADGWMLVERSTGGLGTRLFNPDGSEPEISGNGTRCAAAFALMHEKTLRNDVVITTGAGPKHLRLIEHRGTYFKFEMDMGEPRLEELHAPLVLEGTSFDATILNVGNPQCVIFVDRLPPEWLDFARAAEKHPRFPQRTNVSFVCPLDRHTLDVVFFERGAGETRSSGTGSTAAAAAAILRALSDSPVEIRTPAGPLQIRWEQTIFLTGPAEATGEGSFFFEF
jgi:diaminopimelate epimerase